MSADVVAVLRRVSPESAEAGSAPPDVLFWCPGCRCAHGVWTSRPAPNGARWTWNGDLVKPTFAPSLLVAIEYPQGHGVPPITKRCHSFITDGKIQFLSDCTHELSGKTVPLPPF